MLNKPRALTLEQIEEIKNMRKAGYTIKNLAEEYNVCRTTITYHSSPKQKEKTRQRVQKYNKKHKHELTPKQKEYKKQYMQSPNGKKAVAKSWLRKYIRDGNINQQDVQEVLEEFIVIKQ